MGVLACNRNGCESIMCDRHSHEHGYICWECLSELKDQVENIAGDNSVDVYEFMASPKRNDTHKYVHSVEDVYKEFQER